MARITRHVAVVLLSLACAAYLMWRSLGDWDGDLIPHDSGAASDQASLHSVEVGKADEFDNEVLNQDSLRRAHGSAGSGNLLDQLRQIARTSGSGYRVKVLSEIQRLDLAMQYEVLVTLWREGYDELAAPLLEIALTCAAHGSLSAGVQAPEVSSGGYSGTFVEAMCKTLLESPGSAGLSETVRRIQEAWKARPPVNASLVDPSEAPYSPEEQVALLGRAANDGEFAGRFMTILTDAPKVLLSPQQALYLAQLPKPRRAHVSYAAAALSSCSIFGLCAWTSVAALSFCATPGVECRPGEGLELAVRRNLSSVDLEIALASVERARELYVRRPSAGGSGI
jgi:hypothetical protein